MKRSRSREINQRGHPEKIVNPSFLPCRGRKEKEKRKKADSFFEGSGQKENVVFFEMKEN